ncbi:DOMON domain-containing protein [Flagellimonas sp.]|uniref:DOMON domain-containing protein n=1 Tax=Flagellimonas sp. TaxID=2058762 RepID=UPI003F4A7022
MKGFQVLSVLAFSFYGFAGLYGQQVSKVSDISFTYDVVRDSLVCKLEAPTNGWVGVGFNNKNSIVGSDLLLFNIIAGTASCTDLFVKGVGNPVQDEKNGGKNTITILDGAERNTYTSITFSIPLDSGDRNDFVHQLDGQAWLILAYSVDDDFEHHSRVRKHIPFVIHKD